MGEPLLRDATSIDATLVGATTAGRVRRLDWYTIAAGGFLIVLLGCVIAPGLVAPGDPTVVEPGSALTSPEWGHVMGTDQYGRDVLRRVVHGARVSLGVSVAATVIGALVGCTLGLLAGYVGRWVDAVAMWAVDVMLSFPTLLLALAIVAVLGRGPENVALALGIASIPLYARVLRGQVLSVRERLFIDAARAAGTRPSGILLRHVLPNTIGPVLILATINVGTTLIAASALSFLGLGPAAPSPEWGAILEGGRRFIGRAPWIVVGPGIILVLSVLSVTIVGQWLRDRVGRGTV